MWELRRRNALVVNVLEVEAELVGMRTTDVGEVVDHLRDVLLEVEAGIALAVPLTGAPKPATPEIRIAGPVPGSLLAAEALMAMRVLDTELIQLVRAEGRVRLAGKRVHCIEEVGRALKAC